MEEFAHVVFGIGTHEGDYDDFLVAALESVCCVDFDVRMVRGEEVGQEFELRSVDRHNSNGGGWNAALSECIHSLQLDNCPGGRGTCLINAASTSFVVRSPRLVSKAGTRSVSQNTTLYLPLDHFPS